MDASKSSPRDLKDQVSSFLRWNECLLFNSKVSGIFLFSRFFQLFEFCANEKRAMQKYCDLMKRIRGEKKSDETALGTVRELRNLPLDQSSLSQRAAQLENAARRHSRNSARQRKKNPIKKEGKAKKNAKNAVQDFELFQLFFLHRFRCHHLWSLTLSSSSASCLQTRLFLRTKREEEEN